MVKVPPTVAMSGTATSMGAAALPYQFLESTVIHHEPSGSFIIRTRPLQVSDGFPISYVPWEVYIIWQEPLYIGLLVSS